ncbi:MAG: hypothetical protein HYS22_09030 [Deltaproteobacteria bacterium]|nr:hypothetical protein [Deltaproteobacteria bacterium]
MKKLSFAVVAAFIGVVSSALALTVLSQNLEQLSKDADQIIAGQVIEAKEGFDPEGRPIVTVTLQVEEAYKGEVGRRFSFKQLRAPKPEEGMGESLLSGSLPEYKKGEELVLFLSRPGSLGLTAPIGIMQGKFNVVTDDSGKKQVANLFNNKGLFSGMKNSHSLKSFSGSEKNIVKSSSPGPVNYDTFISLVKKLAQ